MFVLPFGIMKNKECRNDTLETRSAWLHALLPCNIALIAHKAGYHAVQHCLSQAVGLSYIWRRVETFNSWHGDVTGTVCRVTSYIVRLLQPRCTINSLVVKATQPLYLPAAAAASMLHDTTPRNAFNDQCVMTHLSQAVQLSRRLSPSPSRQPWRPCLFLADWRPCSSGPSVVDELAACNDARRWLAGHLPTERQCVCSSTSWLRATTLGGDWPDTCRQSGSASVRFTPTTTSLSFTVATYLMNGWSSRT